MIESWSLPPLFLSSKSPRRQQLMESVGLSFKTVIPEVEEDHPSVKNYHSMLLSNAKRKADVAVKIIQDSKAVVISADTLVVVKDKVLGKPRGFAEARKMLESLSGNKQQVFTGLVLLSSALGSRQVVVESSVYFRKLSQEEIMGYARTVEPYDKAGGYAVQGLGAIFIEKIEGSYTNVMGLPIETLIVELERLTKIPFYRWIEQRSE